MNDIVNSVTNHIQLNAYALETFLLRISRIY